MQSEDSLGHDYLANKDFTVVELMHIFLPSHKRVQSSHGDYNKKQAQRVCFPQIPIPLDFQPCLQSQDPQHMQPIRAVVSLRCCFPSCLSQEWGKIFAVPQFTTGSDTTLDFHQSSEYSAPALSLLLCIQTPTNIEKTSLRALCWLCEEVAAV